MHKMGSNPDSHDSRYWDYSISLDSLPEETQYEISYTVARNVLNSRVINNESKEEIVQETLLKVFTGKAQFKGNTVGELAGWTKTITLHTFANYMRYIKSKRRDESDTTSLTEMQLRTDKKSNAESILIDPALPVLDSLIKEEREKMLMDLVVLWDKEGVFEKQMNGASLPEIGAEIGRSRPAVASLLRQVRVSLKKAVMESNVV